MTVYTSLNSVRNVPSLLKPVYGDTTTYSSLLLIHGGTLLVTALLWWLFRTDSILATPENSQVAMWLLWDLLGGTLAHLTTANHRYWSGLPSEIRLLALASMAWQPLVLVLVFDQPVSVLVELHLLAGLTYWLLQRIPTKLVGLVSIAGWALIVYHLYLPASIALLAFLYCLKVVTAYRPAATMPRYV